MIQNYKEQVDSLDRELKALKEQEVGLLQKVKQVNKQFKQELEDKAAQI